MSIDNLYRLKKKNIKQGAAILADSFCDYPTFSYILGEKSSRENKEIVFQFILRYSVLYAEAYASSSNLEGIILFSDYKDYKFTFFRSLRAGGLKLIKLGQEVGKKFNEYDQFCQEIHKKIIQRPHQYIILLGVDPEEQGKGFGSKLMYPVLKISEEKGQPCYLETHGEKNVAIYKTFGYEVVSEDIVPGTDVVQYGMLRK